MKDKKWIYFDIDGIPAKIFMHQGKYLECEIYQIGHGFTKGEKWNVLSQGKIITKQEFDKRIAQYVIQKNLITFPSNQ